MTDKNENIEEKKAPPSAAKNAAVKKTAAAEKAKKEKEAAKAKEKAAKEKAAAEKAKKEKEAAKAKEKAAKEKAAAAEKAKKEKEAAKAKEKAAKEKAAAAEKAKKEKEAAKAKEKAAKEKAAAAEKAKKEKEAAKAKEKAAKEKAAAAEKAKKEKEAAKAKEKAAKEKAAAAEKAKKEKEAAKAKEKAAKEKAAAAEKAKKEKEAAKAKEKAAKEKAAAAEKAKKEKEAAKAKEKAKKSTSAQAQQSKKSKSASENKNEDVHCSESAGAEETAHKNPEENPNSEDGSNVGGSVQKPSNVEKDESLKQSKNESESKIKLISDKKPSFAPAKQKIAAYKKDIKEELQLRSEMYKNVRTLKKKELSLAKKLEAESEDREGIDRNKEKKKKIIYSCAALAALLVLYLFVIKPESTRHIADIPVYYTNLAVGMNIEQPVNNIDITVKGPRLKMMSLSRADIQAMADMSHALAYGKYSAVINISGMPEGTYLTAQSCAVYSANVIQAANLEFKIDIDYEGEPAEGFLVLENRMSGDKAAVFGSDEDIAQVASVRGKLTLDGKKNDFSHDMSLSAYDKDGNVLGDVHVSPSAVNCAVYVGTTKELPVNIVTTGDVPKRYIFDGAVPTAEKVAVAGNAKLLKKLESIDTEPVALAPYTADTEIVAALDFPEGIYPYNEVESINAVVKVIPMTVVTYQIEQVEIVSLEKGYETDTSSIPSIISVTFGGRAEDMETFSQEDVRLYINVEGKEEGMYKMPVLYNIPEPIYVVSTNAETVPVKIYKPSVE